MSIECLLRVVGNELHDDWTTVLQIFRNFHMAIFLNMFKKGDSSEKSFRTNREDTLCSSELFRDRPGLSASAARPVPLNLHHDYQPPLFTKHPCHSRLWPLNDPDPLAGRVLNHGLQFWLF